MSVSYISLRPVTVEDREFLYRVYASTRVDELMVVPWSVAQKEVFLRQQFEAQDRHYRLAYPDAEFSVIESGLEKIGRWYVWRGKNDFRIVDIAILPDWRRRGFGTTLIRRLQTEAGEASKPLTIHVEEFNPAQRLYQRLGFRRVKQNGIYWLMQWEREVSREAGAGDRTDQTS